MDQRRATRTTAKRRNYREHAEQVALFKWAALHERIEPRLKLMFAVPNGGKRDAIAARWLKDEGLKAGVPDIILPVWSSMPAGKLFGCLVIEMKSERNGRVSKPQKEWAKTFELYGSGVHAVCWSWVSAVEAIAVYLGNPKLRVS